MTIHDHDHDHSHDHERDLTQEPAPALNHRFALGNAAPKPPCFRVLLEDAAGDVCYSVVAEVNQLIDTFQIAGQACLNVGNLDYQNDWSREPVERIVIERVR